MQTLVVFSVLFQFLIVGQIIALRQMRISLRNLGTVYAYLLVFYVTYIFVLKFFPALYATR